MAEQSLIDALVRVLGPPGERVAVWTGDDAAVVRSRPLAVTSIDTVAEGTHFDLASHSPGDVGHKALAAALSDLAAMGAGVGEAYVSLALPPGFAHESALALVEGMAALARRTGTTIAGGDVVGATALVVTVAVTGWADHEHELVRRDGARPSQVVGVTGQLGGSGAGLLALSGQAPDLDPTTAAALAERHRRPEPELAAGRALALAGAAAMIDLSDGIATDARHLATRSTARIEIDIGRLPLAPGVAAAAAAAGTDPHELAATAGEDYELLFAIDEDRWEQAAATAGVALTRLGRVEAGEGVVLARPGGHGLEELRGYEHL